MKVLLLAHAGVTLIMLGMILVVQIVHYPLFSRVGAAGYPAYQAAHMARISFIVAPAMLVELATAVALVVWRPADVPAWMVWAGLALVIVIWLSTAAIQGPIHGALRDGFDAALHQRLVSSNTIRTVAWSLRSVLALALLAPLLRT